MTNCNELARQLDAHRSKLGTQNIKAEAAHAEIAAAYLTACGGTLPRKKYRGR